MKNSLFFIFLCIFYFTSYSQTFPYLNASTGNVSEFPVDKDTSVFMFHGGELKKLKKDLSTIWARSYTNVSFTNLLLSKTGSIYFLGGSSIGKIDAAGNLVWFKSLAGFTVNISGTGNSSGTPTAQQLFLDRNDNLVITGIYNAMGVFMRMDTLGTINRFKFFSSSNYISNFTNCNVISDSLGHYKICGMGISLGGFNAVIMNYSDVADSVTYSRSFSPFGLSGSGTSINFYKSKTNSNNFFLSGVFVDMSSNYFTVTAKCNAYKKQWGHWFKWNGITPNGFNGFTEDEKGNLFITTSSGPSTPNYNSGFLKIDSMGVDGSQVTKYINNYYFGTSYPYQPRDKFSCIHYNNYYFDITGLYFPSNPLTVGLVGPSLSTGCSLTAAITKTLSGVQAISANYSQPTKATLSYTLPSISSIGSNFTFSVNTNYCTVLSVKNIDQQRSSLIFPNPNAGSFTIQNELELEHVHVMITDILGKPVYDCSFETVKNTWINISSLSDGVYYVHLSNPEGFNEVQKIIKQ